MRHQISRLQTELCAYDQFQRQPLPEDVIFYAVFFYIRYAVSYRDLEEIMTERGLKVDHATLSRWGVKYSPLIARDAHRRKSTTNSAWRMDATCIKIKGKWTYLYRTVPTLPDCKT